MTTPIETRHKERATQIASLAVACGCSARIESVGTWLFRKWRVLVEGPASCLLAFQGEMRALEDEMEWFDAIR